MFLCVCVFLSQSFVFLFFFFFLFFLIVLPACSRVIGLENTLFAGGSMHLSAQKFYQLGQ